MKRPFLALVTLPFSHDCPGETQPPALDATEQARVVDARCHDAREGLRLARRRPADGRAHQEETSRRVSTFPASPCPEFAQRAHRRPAFGEGRDRHLSVVFDPERVGELRNPADRDSANAEEERRRLQRMANYSVRKVWRSCRQRGLPQFDTFADADGASKVPVGAMAFLANCDR